MSIVSANIAIACSCFVLQT